jgi:hypothetical protein
MALAINTPADLVNLALARIGYPNVVGDLYDGSAASAAALIVYSQTLDASLREGDYGFAQRQVSPTLLKEAPADYFDTPWTTANPPLPWRYSYDLPSDYLKVRSVRPAPGFIFNPDPAPLLFAVVNDSSYTPTRRVLVCNQAAAVMYYTAQVTSPALWSADFIEVMADALAKRLAPVLADFNISRVNAQDEAVEAVGAASRQG